ncbi:MAG: hypothetical protein ABI772_05570 [Bacteroidota bacterium]
MKFIALLLSGLLLIFSSVNAQEKEKETAERKDYRKEPVWIKMMEDPHVNYYEAIEAFEAYWEGKEEPEEEEEMINEGKISKEHAAERRAERATWTQAQRNEYENMKYQFKRFKNWKRTVFPFVQSDGRILTEQERMDIYNKQNKQ